MFLILLVLLSTFPNVHSLCDTVKGCYPPVFDISDKFLSYPATSVYASSTCGSNSSNPVQFRSANTSDVNLYTCQPASLQPNNVVDDDTNLLHSTYWQSDKMTDGEGATSKPQFIIFTFTEDYLFHTVIIKFKAVHAQSLDNSVDARPAAFSIEKMDSTNQNWITLQHFARECAKYFPGIPIYDPFSSTSDPTQLHCVQFDSVENGQFSDYNNEVEYSPGLRYDTYDNAYKNNFSAITRYTVSAIRIFIHEPANISPLMSYVAISDVLIDVQCKCHGHADSCEGQNNATCRCQHNTYGKQCNICLPLFNNRSWSLGTTVDAGECLACNCNNRSTSCSFILAKGHGVCNNCTDNSFGDSCDSCVSGFYVNPTHVNISKFANTTASSDKTSVSIDHSIIGDKFCLACSCNPDGTQAMSLSTCDTMTGQCVCKDRVTQRDCSSCRDTFWGLSTSKPLGCDACNCNPQGCLGGINMCNKTTGACICKSNVEGNMCDRCKLYTFNFDPSNPDGCTSCDCDPGASTSKTCDLFSGQCSCYRNIGGRDCRLPLTGYYVPRLDALILEPEAYTSQGITLRSGHGSKNVTFSGRGFVKLTSTNQINITFSSPLTAVMNVVLRFEKTTSDNFIFLQGLLSLKTAGNYNCSDGQIISTGKQWTLMFTGILDNNRGGANMGKVCLSTGAVYSIKITSPTSAILVDSVVFLVDTTSVILALKDLMDVDNVTKCVQSAVDLVRSSRDHCAKVEYSISAAVLQKALPCFCTSGALASTSCDSYSGDCKCLPGVLTPDCTQCMVDHFQFNSAAGCKACGCHKNGSLLETCDDLGVCQCLPNVLGPKCDSCLSDYYGLHTGKGCTSCQCNLVYSINNNCSDYGDCACLPGVTGLTCDVCHDGFYNMTTYGCTPCACNPDGSTERSCDMKSGNCECQSRVEGSTCSRCKPGYFGLGKWHPDGCISCFCWGHGLNCTSDSDWCDVPIISSWLILTTHLISDTWQIVDTNGTKVNVLSPVVKSTNESQYALRVDEAQRGLSDIFYLAPDKFLGDKKSSYGRFLNLTLKPSPKLQSSGEPAESGDTIAFTVEMTGAFSNVTLVYTYTDTRNSTTDNELFINILLHESEWQAVATTSSANDSILIVNKTATYAQMMETLSNLASLKILAYRANMSSSAMDLLSVRLDSAVHGSKCSGNSGLTVNNVEMCACEPGYTGSSCEQCAQHYTRAVTNSTNPNSKCILCDCNGHGIISCDELDSNCSMNTVRSCDPQSGVCQCQHNTRGDYCETCLPGYYGDPRKGTKDDCQPCACPGVIVAKETNVFALSCSQNSTGEAVCDHCQEGHMGNHCELCIDGYFGTPENATNFGGACRLCECNGKADICNTRTGECIGCRNNTAGHNCEICATGYFGDAVNSTCQLCACNASAGSTGTCSHVTGACECFSNVSGVNCDVCIDGYFNLVAGIGCEPCNCFMNGSSTSVCNKTTGQCSCTKFVTGRTCNECLPSYWNVNSVTSCDDCQCSPQGTITENGTTITSCNIITGQCTCALPGILGRTCDHCSPVSTKTFEHVRLFYSGTYPSCELCGECFDSWASRVEEIGQILTQLNKTVLEKWSVYDSQTAKEIDASLTAVEEKINRTAQYQKDFESVATQFKEIQRQFSETQVKYRIISNDVDMLTLAEQTLIITLTSMTDMTDVVQVTNSTMARLTDLHQQFLKLSKEAETSVTQGNSSWSHFQSLIFVVSAPEDRERQLHAQEAEIMDIAAHTNQTFLLTKTLYDTSLTIGVNEKTRELTSISERVSNISLGLKDMKAVIANVESGISGFSSSLRMLLVESASARSRMLNSVSGLQVYVTNASQALKASEKLLTEVNTFKTVAEKSEQTIISSATTLLEYILVMLEAQNNLTTALALSSSSLTVQIPTGDSIQQLADHIANSALSNTEVESLEMSSQQAKFIANQAVMKAQRALTLSKELNEEVRLMEDDIILSDDLRVQAQGLRMSCDNLNNSIHDVLQQEKNHSDKFSADTTAVTQSAQEMQAEIKNVTSCLAQRQLDVTNSVTAASQTKERADSASSAHMQLLQTMLQISSNAPLDVLQIVSDLTRSYSVMKQIDNDLEQIEALGQIEVLRQELQDQNQQINDLDLEITSLTSQLDSIIVLLQESAGGTNCNKV